MILKQIPFRPQKARVVAGLTVYQWFGRNVADGLSF
jgi:hypothetical protein